MTDTSASRPADDQQAKEKWSAYPRTVLEFEGGPRLRIDLRKPMVAGDRAALAARGLRSPFGVFTAENPAGDNAEDQPTPEQERTRERTNQRREGRLERELIDRGVAFVRVDGVSPDGGYREHCLATLMPRGEAVALARRYQQLALFWYDGSDFWLLPGIADEEPVKLPAGGTHS